MNNGERLDLTRKLMKDFAILLIRRRDNDGALDQEVLIKIHKSICDLYLDAQDTFYNELKCKEES